MKKQILCLSNDYPFELDSNRFETSHAFDVSSVVEKIKNSFPDLIVASIDCSKSKATEMLKALDDCDIFKHVPVIILGTEANKLDPSIKDKVYLKSCHSELSSFAELAC